MKVFKCTTLTGSTTKKMNHFDLLIDSFMDNKIGIDNGFISKTLSRGLQENIVQLQKDGLMVAAGVGNEEVMDSKQKMRGDKIYWMDKNHSNIFEQEFLVHIENFIEYINRTCYTGINGYEFHYAVYEAGSGYKRHKDQFKNDSNRKFSLIHYLNENWVDENGGNLQVYQNDSVQQIRPESQTAIFFKSDEMEHEVSKSNRSRMSVTGWLKRI